MGSVDAHQDDDVHGATDACMYFSDQRCNGDLQAEGEAMYARTSTWSGSPETLQKWAEHCEGTVRGFVEGLPGNAGVMFFLDAEAGRALTLTLWQTEAAAVASDQFADKSRESTVAATGAEMVTRARYQVVGQAKT